MKDFVKSKLLFSPGVRTFCSRAKFTELNETEDQALFTTSGPRPGELPGFWGSMVFRHAPFLGRGRVTTTRPGSELFQDEDLEMEIKYKRAEIPH